MKSPINAILVLVLSCLSYTLSAQFVDDQKKTSETSEPYYFLNQTELAELKNEDANSKTFQSELLKQSYTISSTGIHFPQTTSLYIRIKSLDFSNVTPMPGAFDLTRSKKVGPPPM